ncbi:MAG TPA: chemotaxis protein CheW [Candidatus Brocadiaceae bacterium]
MINVLVFKTNGFYFGIDTAYVLSVSKNPTVVNDAFSSVPSDRFVEIDGRKTPVVDFLNAGAEKNWLTHFIMVSFSDNEWVIPIDEVIDIFQVAEKDILHIPVFVEKHLSRQLFLGVFSMKDTLILMLDVNRVFSCVNILQVKTNQRC